MTVMKKILLISLLLVGLLNMYAEDVTVVFKKRTSVGKDPIGNRENAPMRLPVSTDFDYSTGVLTISAPDELEGYVYISSFTGAQECTSPQLNCTLTLPQTSDIHVISLQGETWIGEAKIVY